MPITSSALCFWGSGDRKPSPQSGRLSLRRDAGAKPKAKAVMRIAACQAKRRSIDWRLKKPADVLAAVDKNLDELEKIVHKAGDAKCDVLELPEDTLGLLDWGGMNEAAAKEVLPEAVKRMLDRLGRAAAKHHMYLVVCSDLVEADGKTYNTAFFLGRDGKEIGRYHKVCPTWGESGSRARGKSFPVFPTADLGTVGMLICYDLVFPETARCLALQGADIIFFPTMGGAAVGDDDIGVQALRVRAAENHVYLVVAHRGQRRDDHLTAGKDHRPGRGRRRAGHRRHRPARRPRRGRLFQHPKGHAGPALPRAQPRSLQDPDRTESPRAGQGADRHHARRSRPHLRPDVDRRGRRVQSGGGPGPRGQDEGSDRRVREAADRVSRKLDRPRRPGSGWSRCGPNRRSNRPRTNEPPAKKTEAPSSRLRRRGWRRSIPATRGSSATRA